jgi:hypothetical protein
VMTGCDGVLARIFTACQHAITLSGDKCSLIHWSMNAP